MKPSRTTVFAVACAALLATSGPVLRAAPGGIQTNLPGVTSAPAPPDGFDPISASDQDLETYGFPPRPDAKAQPKVYAAWAKGMRASRHRIVPQLQVTERIHGPFQTNGTSSGSFNWNGAVATDGAVAFSKPNSLHIASAYIVVPPANPPFGQCPQQEVYSSQFAGIDGTFLGGSNNIFQAGTESDAQCQGGATKNYYAWFEWYGTGCSPSLTPICGEVKVTNLNANPGQTIFVYVYALTPTSGGVYFINLDTNQSVSIGVANANAPLTGTSAEWILERPTLRDVVTNGGGTLTNLTNYGSDVFWDCIAVTSSGAIFGPGSPNTIQQPGSTIFTMVDNNSQLISYASALGTNALLFQVYGSAK
jgi:hypothetical protein